MGIYHVEPSTTTKTNLLSFAKKLAQVTILTIITSKSEILGAQSLTSEKNKYIKIEHRRVGISIELSMNMIS